MYYGWCLLAFILVVHHLSFFFLLHLGRAISDAACFLFLILCFLEFLFTSSSRERQFLGCDFPKGQAGLWGVTRNTSLLMNHKASLWRTLCLRRGASPVIFYFHFFFEVCFFVTFYSTSISQCIHIHVQRCTDYAHAHADTHTSADTHAHACSYMQCGYIYILGWPKSPGLTAVHLDESLPSQCRPLRACVGWLCSNSCFRCWTFGVVVRYWRAEWVGLRTAMFCDLHRNSPYG